MAAWASWRSGADKPLQRSVIGARSCVAFHCEVVRERYIEVFVIVSFEPLERAGLFVTNASMACSQKTSVGELR